MFEGACRTPWTQPPWEHLQTLQLARGRVCFLCGSQPGAQTLCLTRLVFCEPCARVTLEEGLAQGRGKTVPSQTQLGLAH